jgi:ABC-type Na+ efflux pump permease subunit
MILNMASGNDAERKWLQKLEEQPPEWFTEKNRIPILRGSDPQAGRQRGLMYPDDYLIVTLQVRQGSQGYRAQYEYPLQSQQEALLYRSWINSTTQKLRGQPVVEEFLPTFSATQLSESEDRTAKIITALVIFAFYLLSFNLYITSTAEEREKKVLLALMLTPARASEIIGAKVIFYSVFSLLISAGVIALFDASLLLRPLLWSTILCGSVCYVCIGTVVLCIIRRQSTINTVSMMYLIITALVMSLSVFLLPFMVLRFMMIENYLFHQLEYIIAGKPNPVAPIYQPLMVGITICWFLLAVFIFSKRGVAVGQVRR